MNSKNPPTARKRTPRWKAPPPDSVISCQIDNLTETNDRPIPLKQTAFGQAIAWKLRDLALRGDAKALTTLVVHAREFVRALNSIAQLDLELLRPIARSSTTWPTMHSRSPLVSKTNDQLFNDIELGAAVGPMGLDISVVSSKKSPAKKWASCLLDFIFNLRGLTEQVRRLRHLLEPLDQGADSVVIKGSDLSDMNGFIALVESNEEWPLPCQKHTEELASKCHHLPPLAGNDEENINQWWSVGYELLMLNTDGKPEEVAELAAIGQNRKLHVSALNVSGPDDVYMPKSVNANVRSKILTELREEFGRMARQLSKVTKPES